MTKTFRLTIDFKAEIAEYIQGVKNKKVEEFTREIIGCFLSDPRMRVEFLKQLFYSRYLFFNDPGAVFKKVLGIKTEEDILRNFLPKVSAETSFYLKTICCPEYKDFEYEGEDGSWLDLILGHFPFFHLINGSLTEIGDEENKENDCLVKEEAAIAGNSHAESRVREG
jgi:hypothetical protein